MANAIRDHNAKQTDGWVRLAGFAVGNPTTDFEISADSYYPFMAEHLLIGPDRFALLNATCKGQYFKPPSQECADLVQNITKTDLALINPYDITAKCLGAGPSPHGGCFTTAAALAEHGPLGAIGSQTFVPCLSIDDLEKYFNREDVFKAFHPIPQTPRTWTACSQSLKYTQYTPSMIPFYQKLAGATAFPGGPPLRLMIYSGDVDSCVNTRGTMACVKAMDFDLVEEWHPWTYQFDSMPQTGGYMWKMSNGFIFATVRGAGHLVPSQVVGRPPAALTLFSSWLAGTL